MSTLQVKNLPDDVHAALAKRARDESTTMSELVTRLLRRELSRPTFDEWDRRHPAAGTTRPIDVAHALDEVRVEYAPDDAPARATTAASPSGGAGRSGS